MICSGKTIRELQPVKPFSERSQHESGLTYGLSPAGFDIRIAEEFDLAPGGFRLASSVEEFDMPVYLLGIVHDKSTWARVGLALQNTVIEPGWHGFLTLELSNHGNDVLHFVKGMPIAQVIFHFLDAEAENQGYSGRYQGQQAGPQPARRSSPLPPLSPKALGKV